MIIYSIFLGVPLVYETFNWLHGVFVGASLKSEATAAAEHAGKISPSLSLSLWSVGAFSGKTIMHDPMAMRPFMGYNFGKYLEHWISMDKPPHKVPKIFHVNWFRLDTKTKKFLWPGFGEVAC